MKTLGIAVTLRARPILTLALLEASASDVQDADAVKVKDTFEIPLEDRPLAAQLGEAAKAIRGRVRSLAPDTVVVRRADRPARASNQEGPRKRLLIEGAVVAAAYAEIQRTTLLSGKECGQAYGSDKASLDELAAGQVDPKYKEAAAAAIAGLGQATARTA